MPHFDITFLNFKYIKHKHKNGFILDPAKNILKPRINSNTPDVILILKKY